MKHTILGQMYVLIRSVDVATVDVDSDQAVS